MKSARSIKSPLLNDFLKTRFPVNLISRRNVLEFYGAIQNVADYCGMKSAHITRNDIVWQHGWKPEYFSVSPKVVIGYNNWQPEYMHLVARQDQSKFLSSFGYERVKAIGLPVCYLPETFYPRIPNSLLVMPVHSLAYTDHEHWNFEDYADAIYNVRGSFERVVVCVHPSCFKRGYWVNQFQKLGIEVIEGVDIYDRNALHRMQYLLQSFEYVTTNGFGSHIAYGAYFGAKVSIFGNYCELKEEDFINSKYYQDNPEILAGIIEMISERTLREKLSFLFTHPKKAIDNKSWGEYEVGHQSRLSPDKLKEIFGWGTVELLKHKAKMYAKAAYRRMKMG